MSYSIKKSIELNFGKDSFILHRFSFWKTFRQLNFVNLLIYNTKENLLGKLYFNNENFVFPKGFI